MLKGKKLLLADDSTTIQKVVNLTFADEGIEVVAVGDGDAAMQKFVEHAPDLVMVDVNMPGADGYKICEIIKGDEETAHIPVILLVGSFEPFDKAEAERVGADAFLTKPFQSIRQLAGKVHSLLDASPSAAAAVGEETDYNNETFSGASIKVTAKAEDDARQTVKNDDAEIYAATDANVYYADDYNESAATRFDDVQNDDDAVQTNQIGSLPADEAQKFSAKSADEIFPFVSAAEPFETSSNYELEKDDSAETKPATVRETSADVFVSDEHEPASSADAPISEAASERNFQGEKSVDEPLQNVEADKPRNFSWDFDDTNFLELSFKNNETSNARTAEDRLKVAGAETESNEIIAPQTVGTNESAAAPQQMTNVSPELIERIAARVAEKLSDRIIEAIRRELGAQTPNLIAEELARETSKN